LAIGCWIAMSNTDTYNVTQMQQADAILKGMEVNNTKVDNTISSPFYNSSQTNVNPFMPVYMSDRSFGVDKDISRKNPLGDLSWLTRK